MRLLHFADLHLGIENYGTLDPSTGLSTRVHDFLRGFDRIVERAIEERVDAVLFAGDAFKNRDPSPTIQREFARRIGRLAKADIPVVLLIGNHDLPNTMQRAAPTEIYQTLEIPGVYVCRQMDLLVVPTRSGPLQVVTLPWLPRSLMFRATTTGRWMTPNSIASSAKASPTRSLGSSANSTPSCRPCSWRT